MKDNPKYKIEYTSKIFDTKGNPLTGDAEPLRYYSLANIADYHISRYIAANAQNMYSAAGITPDVMTSICDRMISAVNEKKIADVAVLANNLKYRTKYPVDEHAILRMAMIYILVDGEDPDKCENHWTEWKLQRILAEPEAHSFFLPIGAEFTPAYKEYLQEISPISLQERTMILRTISPDM